MPLLDVENCGIALAKLRQERGVTAASVAQKLGFDKSTMSKFEGGTREVKLGEYVAYMEVLGLLAGDFLPRTTGVPEPARRIVTMIEGRSTSELRRVENVVSAVLDVPVEVGDNVLQFVPAKPQHIPTSDEQIDSLEKAMTALGTQPRRARKGQDYPVPLIANLSAGKGLESFTREHETRDINAYYWNRGVRAVFRVVGNSMIDMGITDRDLVYVRPVERAAPKNGEVIACTLNNESYVKVYEKDESGAVWLKSKANGFEPIRVKDDDELRIWGVVLGRTGDL